MIVFRGRPEAALTSFDPKVLPERGPWGFEERLRNRLPRSLADQEGSTVTFHRESLWLAAPIAEVHMPVSKSIFPVICIKESLSSLAGAFFLMRALHLSASTDGSVSGTVADPSVGWSQTKPRFLRSTCFKTVLLSAGLRAPQPGAPSPLRSIILRFVRNRALTCSPNGMR
jgi:hypothetical protein